MALQRVGATFEIATLKDELAKKEKRELIVRNNGLIRAGKAAIASGAVNDRNVLQLTRDTVRRHLGLIKLLGIATEKVLEKTTARGRFKRFFVASNPVLIDPERQLWATLVQQSSPGLAGNTEADRFLRAYRSSRDAVLAENASPGTTGITVFTPINQRNGIQSIVDKVELAPRRFKSTGPETDKFKSHAFPFFGKPEFDSLAAMDVAIAKPDQVLSLKALELVMAAGLITVFNRDLDIVEESHAATA